MRKSLINILALLALLTITTAQDNWEKINSPAGGSVSSFAITESGNVFAFILHYGIVKYIDQENSWRLVHNFYPNKVISGGITNIDDTLFVSVGEDYGSQESFSGILKSTDMGNTWDLINSVYGTDISSTPKGVLFLLNGLNAKFLKSDDGGNSWETVFGWYDLDYVNDFEVVDDSTSYLLTSTQLIKSNNNWESWTVNELPKNFHYNVFSIEVTNMNSILLGSWDKIYRSQNFGETWDSTALYSLEKYSQVVEIKELERGYLLASAFNNYQYGELVFSRDDGKSWQPTSFEKYNISTIAEREDKLFLGTMEKSYPLEEISKGIFTSSDGGVTWTASNEGLLNYDIHNLFITSSGNFLAATMNDIYLSRDGGESWEPSFRTNQPNENYPVQKFLEKDEKIYFSNQSGIYVSADFGESWELFISKGALSFDFLKDGGFVFIEYIDRKLLLTYDGGGSYEEIFLIYSYDFVVNDLDYIFIAGRDRNWTHTPVYLGVFRSYNRVDSLFHQTDLNLNVNSLVLDKFDRLYVSVPAGWENNSQFTEVYFSDDYGDNWYWMSNELTTDTDIRLYLHNGKTLVAGGRGNPYGGNSDDIFIYKNSKWEKYADGILPGKPLVNANFRYSFTSDEEKYLYLGAHGGIYKTLLPLVTSVNKEENLPQEFSLSQNYPNPFNPNTKIKFNIPNVGDAYYASPTNITLIVYDILGREVATLLNKPMQPGSYEVSFDGSDLPSGIYFYRLTSGQFTQTRKMLLIK